VPFHPKTWQPSTVLRFVRTFQTAMRTALVETDAGEGYLKALGNPEGPHALACELVGSLAAEWLGLATLDFDIIAISPQDCIPLTGVGQASPGPAFITRSEPTAFPWGGDAKALRSVTNPKAISHLVVLDTWLANCDRHAPDGKRRNLDNVMLVAQGEQQPNSVTLMAMDFTHAFTCGDDLDKKLGYLERIQDTKIYGLFPEFEEFLCEGDVGEATDRLRTISYSETQEWVARVPLEWEVATATRSTLAKFIVDRGRFVAETIQDQLWPQLPLTEVEGTTDEIS
jgi:hypothetical protein